MKGSRVAKRYAIALFEGAKEQQLLDTVAEHLRVLETTYHEVETFQQLIDSPVISNEEKLKVVDQLFAQKLHPFVLNFLKLLIRKNREMLLPAMVEYFNELLDEHRGILRGVVYTVVAMTDEQLQALNQRLNAMTGKTVVLTQQIDTSLIGGFVVQIKDMVIDNSIRHQLEKLKERLVETSV